MAQLVNGSIAWWLALMPIRHKHIFFQPQPGGGLTNVRATLDTPYGLVVSAWVLTDVDFRLQVTVPPNAYATVRLPTTQLATVTEGGQPVTLGNGIIHVWVTEEGVQIEVGAGVYDFVTTALTLPQTMANVNHVAGRLDRYSSLRDLLAHDAAKEVLTHYLGAEFLPAPPLFMVMDAPLSVAANFAPTVLTDERLNEIAAALLKLN